MVPVVVVAVLVVSLSICLSARLKAELPRETSSVFELENIKNEAILRDVLQKWKVECRADGLVPMRFAIFPLHPSKLLRLPRKSDARSYEVLHLSRKIISAKTLAFCSLLTRCTFPCACHAKRHFKVQKWREHVVFLTLILTSKCASRHNGVHFFDIATSKSAPELRSFLHFDFEMCCAPQRRALFRHLTLTSKSGPNLVCFVHFDFDMCFAPQGVEFFDSATSKSAPNPAVFYTFDFEMCFALQRCAIFHLSSGQLAPHPPL